MTLPAVEADQPVSDRPNYLIVAPVYKDPVTGATFVHQDLVRTAMPWEEENHVPLMKADEKLGDVESWVSYVQRFNEAAFLTWNSKGLAAVFDYTERRQWLASMPFTLTPEFLAWNALATGQAVAHAKAVEFLEDHAPDIFDPDETSLLNLLRSLRANSAATATAELRPDGTASVAFTKDTSVRSGTASVELPAEITIAIPVLRGHLDDKGSLVRYKLVLKLRASVGADAHLALRFTMPLAERVLEQVYAERVTDAKALLGDGFTILRAAG